MYILSKEKTTSGLKICLRSVKNHKHINFITSPTAKSGLYQGQWMLSSCLVVYLPVQLVINVWGHEGTFMSTVSSSYTGSELIFHGVTLNENFSILPLKEVYLCFVSLS